MLNRLLDLPLNQDAINHLRRHPELGPIIRGEEESFRDMCIQSGFETYNYEQEIKNLIRDLLTGDVFVFRTGVNWSTFIKTTHNEIHCQAQGLMFDSNQLIDGKRYYELKEILGEIDLMNITDLYEEFLRVDNAK